MDLYKFIKKLIEHGVGEIIFNSIERDGTMTGYDKSLIELVCNSFNLPFIISGGCQSSEDMHFAEQKGFSGAAAGSIFYWQGDSIISLKTDLLKMGSNVRSVV